MGDVDIRPDHASEGGGLIDDFDGTISDMRFVMTDYDGAMAEPVPVCRVTFDVDGEESVQLYSVGGQGDFAPDDTGRGLRKLKSKSSLTKTCKYIMFADSLVQAGFPVNRLDGNDCSSIIGTSGHFLRKAVEYKGLKRKKDDRDNTVLLCTKVITLPGEAAAKGKGKGKGVANPTPASNDALAEAVAGIIVGILKMRLEDEGVVEMAKKDLITALFKNAELNALGGDKKAALKLAADDVWLGSRDEWKLDSGILSLV